MLLGTKDQYFWKLHILQDFNAYIAVSSLSPVTYDWFQQPSVAKGPPSLFFFQVYGSEVLGSQETYPQKWA